MAEMLVNRPNQLVAVILAHSGDAHMFQREAHKIGHDAYPEFDPSMALQTLGTQHGLYGFVNAVVVDVSVLGKMNQFSPIKELSDGTRRISGEIPLFGYTSKFQRLPQLIMASALGVIDGFLWRSSVSPQAILDAYPQAIQRRMAALNMNGITQ